MYLKRDGLMGKLQRATSYVSNDEPGLSISEIDRMTPDNRERHRYQIIYVIRDGEPAEFTKDLGKVSNFSYTNQFCIPSFTEYTVGELMDMAFTIRETPPFDKLELAGVNKVRVT